MPIKVEIATKRGLEVLAVFRDGARTHLEARQRLNISSPNALARHLANLEKRGLIERSPRKHRSVRVTRAGIAALESASA